MKIRTLASTSHGRKILFDKILSAELAVCKYKIKAFYEWKNKAQIFSLRFIDTNTVELGININFAMENVFFGSNKAMELTIGYRSYYIAAYLRCLESATSTVPDTLFQGLVVLEAIETIHGGTAIASYSPLSFSVASRVKPIVVHCAIRSLSRICMEQSGFLSHEVQTKCDDAINWMVSYTCLPEVEYNKPKKPEYTVFSDLLCIKKLVTVTPTLLEQYSLFNQYGILNFDVLTVSNILANDELSDFWISVLIRVLAFSMGKASVLDVASFPQIRKGIVKFKENSLAYYNECGTSNKELLSANLLAIKKIAMKIEQTFFENGAVETGALHFVQ